MKIAIERIFTSKLRQNAAIEPIFSTFMRDAPSPHITFRDGRSVPPPLVLVCICEWLSDRHMANYPRIDTLRRAIFDLPRQN